MLGLEPNGKLVPMSPTLRYAPDGKTWFISTKDTELVKDAGEHRGNARCGH
jgi:hypothetical protein